MKNREKRPEEQGVECDVFDTDLLDVDGLAEHLVEQYNFVDTEAEAGANVGEEDKDAVREAMKAEIKGWVDNLFTLLSSNKVADEDVRVGVEKFLDKYPQGTDLDEEFGASQAGFVDAVQESTIDKIVVKEFGPAIAIALDEILTKFTSTNVDLDRLTELVDLVRIIKPYEKKFSEEELVAALTFAKESIEATHRAHTDMEARLERTIKVMEEAEAGKRMKRLKDFAGALGFKMDKKGRFSRLD